MVLSTPSAHAPFIPAPQYRGEFESERAPRTPGESSSYSQGTPTQLALEIQLILIVVIGGKNSCYLLTGWEMIRLLMQLNLPPSLSPVPARGREARKRNPSIASRPIWVVNSGMFWKDIPAKRPLEMRRGNQYNALTTPDTNITL